MVSGVVALAASLNILESNQAPAYLGLQEGLHRTRKTHDWGPVDVSAHLGERKVEAKVEGGHGSAHTRADDAGAYADHQLPPQHVHEVVRPPQRYKGGLQVEIIR